MLQFIDCQCTKCGTKFEEAVEAPVPKFGEPVDVPCPTCNLKYSSFRIPNKAGLEFKGSGWFISDYGGKKQR